MRWTREPLLGDRTPRSVLLDTERQWAQFYWLQVWKAWLLRLALWFTPKGWCCEVGRSHLDAGSLRRCHGRYVLITLQSVELSVGFSLCMEPQTMTDLDILDKAWRRRKFEGIRCFWEIVCFMRWQSNKEPIGHFPKKGLTFVVKSWPAFQWINTSVRDHWL